MVVSGLFRTNVNVWTSEAKDMRASKLEIIDGSPCANRYIHSDEDGKAKKETWRANRTHPFVRGLATSSELSTAESAPTADSDSSVPLMLGTTASVASSEAMVE